jgi:soluble lytic murein transglycosylase-like protein
MDARDRYDSLLQFYAAQRRLDWRLLKAQVAAESDFNPDARSRVGALGLAQFMPATWAEWADGTPGVQPLSPSELMLLDPRDPEDCIRAQATYLAWLLARFPADTLHAALAAYNWGIGNVRAAMRDHGSAWLDHAPLETRQYVERIEQRYARLMAADNPAA